MVAVTKARGLKLKSASLEAFLGEQNHIILYELDTGTWSVHQQADAAWTKSALVDLNPFPFCIPVRHFPIQA